MSTRAKFHCGLSQKVGQPTQDSTRYSFTAVTQGGTPEDELYYRATPNGRLELVVDNPAVTFEPGRAYYLDITPADDSDGTAHS